MYGSRQTKLTSLHSSTRMKNRSKRDMIGAVRLMFCCVEEENTTDQKAHTTHTADCSGDPLVDTLGTKLHGTKYPGVRGQIRECPYFTHNFLKALLYVYNLNCKWIRCHCTSGVGVCGIHILSLPTVYAAAVYDELLCEVTCIVHAIIYWL